MLFTMLSLCAVRVEIVLTAHISLQNRFVDKRFTVENLHIRVATKGVCECIVCVCV